MVWAGSGMSATRNLHLSTDGGQTFNVTNNFTGVGPSFGLNAKWNAFKNFNLIGDVSTALMYGRWNESDIYNRPAAVFGVIPAATIFTSMNQSKLGTLMMDYYLGLQH